MNPTRRGALRGAAAMLSSIALPGALRAQGKPLRIGSTLALTGPLVGDRRRSTSWSARSTSSS